MGEDGKFYNKCVKKSKLYYDGLAKTTTVILKPHKHKKSYSASFKGF